MDSFFSYILTLFRKAPSKAPSPPRRARGKAAPASERDPRAVALREMLAALYKPQHPFRLSVQDRKPKTRAGIYSPRFARITVYAGIRLVLLDCRNRIQLCLEFSLFLVLLALIESKTEEEKSDEDKSCYAVFIHSLRLFFCSIFFLL